MRVRFSGIAVFAALAFVVGFVKPFSPDLGGQGHLVLAAVLLAVGIWVFAARWIPTSVAAMVMLALILAAGVSYPVVFNGYTTRSIWILIPALFFGFALTKTGLGKRLAYLVMRFFKPSYLTLTLSWIIIGLVLSVLTPSITVRIAIVIPIAAASVEICRVKSGSSGNGLVMLAAWAMAIIPGTGWLTGSLWGPMAMGFFATTPGLEDVITFGSWFKAMLLPSELLAILFVLGLYWRMRPKQALEIEKDVFKSEYSALGPVSPQEKATLAILIVTFLLLVTAQWHKIPDVAVVMGAFALLSAVGVIKLRDIGPAISWDLVVFLGAIMGLGTIFHETGVSNFLSHAFSPALNTLAANPWLLLFSAFVGLFVWRFLDVAQLYATIPFIIPLLPLLASSFGIHPLVVYSIIVMVGNNFLLTYQQPFAVLGESLAGQAAWTPTQLRQAGLIYFAAGLITLAAAIPYWKYLGLIR